MKDATVCGLVVLTLLFWVRNIEGGDQYRCYECRAMVHPKLRKLIVDPDGPKVDNVDDCMNGPKRYQSFFWNSPYSFYCSLTLYVSNENNPVTAGRFLRHYKDRGAWPDNDPRWGSCHVVLRKEEEDSLDQVECTCHSDNCNKQLYQEMLTMRWHFKGVSNRIQNSLALMITLLLVLVVEKFMPLL